MTPPDSGEREPNLPCPHGRASWHYCPHCLGLNAPLGSSVQLIQDSKRPVLISQDLAQRILAALECKPALNTATMASLAAELRAHLPKEPK